MTMRNRKTVCWGLFALVIFGVLQQGTSHNYVRHQYNRRIKVWGSIEEFPFPDNAVADPDQILSDVARQNLVQKLDTINNGLSIRVGAKQDVKEDNNIPVQMAVAMVEQLSMPTEYDDRDIEEATEKFARALHDKWGVGFDTAIGGTGVLIFMDVYNRIVYISRGGALDKILSDTRIDGVIQDMTPALRQAKYEEGISQGIDLIVELIERGEPTIWEHFLNLFRVENLFVFIWIYIFANGINQTWKKRREQRAYAVAASQLSELDRAQAEALQGNYHPQNSCPICLENFHSSAVGSDGQPIKLLRCGHVFDEECWSDWVASGRGDVSKCPICRHDVGPRPSAAPSNNQQSTTNSAENIEENAPSAAPTESPVDVDDRTRNEASMFERLLQNESGSAHMDRAAVDDAIINNDRDQALRLFQQERNFRLLRLSTVYSRFITPNQLNLWTSPTYRGQMVQDASFVNNNPSRNLRNAYSSSQDRGFGRMGFGGGGFSGGFGGGTSSGGRSGRF